MRLALLFPSLFLWAAASLSACDAASSNSVHVRVRMHHKEPSHVANTNAKSAHVADPKQLVHIIASNKAAFDELLANAAAKKLPLDVWRVRRDGTALRADISTTRAVLDALQSLTTPVHNKGRFKSRLHTASGTLQIKQESTENEVDLVVRDRSEVAACLSLTKGFFDDLKVNGVCNYTASAYFDCFRPYDQIYEFFDTLTTANPTLLTKIANISKTYEGRGIHAYKLSTSSTAKQEKRALFTQALMHAREWQGGASTHFTMASLLDDLRAGDNETRRLFDEYDWYFVPMVNVDGYKYSWEVDRYWRTNRHEANGYSGVDLNRNFPPLEYFNLDPTSNDDEINPGVAPLSEPETRGLYDFIMNIPNLNGFVDVHAYAGMVLRPFSDAPGAPKEPYRSAMKRLGDAVRDIMSPEGQYQYVSQLGGDLYPAYGCIDDGIYRATNFTVPTLTIEVEGDDFIASQRTIRKVGLDVNRGLRRFATAATKYREMIENM